MTDLFNDRHDMVRECFLKQFSGDFIAYDRGIFADPTISLRAKGLYAIMRGLSYYKKTPFELDINDISKYANISAELTYTLLNELKEKNLLYFQYDEANKSVLLHEVYESQAQGDYALQERNNEMVE